MTPYLRCSAIHDEVRWAKAGGEFCWMCGAAGRPFVAFTITSIEAFVRDLDDVLAQAETHRRMVS